MDVVTLKCRGGRRHGAGGAALSDACPRLASHDGPGPLPKTRRRIQFSGKAKNASMAPEGSLKAARLADTEHRLQLQHGRRRCAGETQPKIERRCVEHTTGHSEHRGPFAVAHAHPPVPGR
jgi:hypothetical protein